MKPRLIRNRWMDKRLFRNAANQRYTSQLFYDKWVMLPEDKRIIKPYYTLQHDKEGLINFRKEYVRDEDPTGYKTSQRLLEDYAHWNMLMDCSWFKEAKEEWDKELVAKLSARSLAVMEKIMVDDENKPSERLSAAKAVLEYFGAKSPTVRASRAASRGRPSTEEVQGEIKRQASHTKDVNEDLQRIRAVTFIKGNQ